MSAASNARSHAEDFHWWRGAPGVTEEAAKLRDLIALRDATVELIDEHRQQGLFATPSNSSDKS